MSAQSRQGAMIAHPLARVTNDWLAFQTVPCMCAACEVCLWCSMPARESTSPDPTQAKTGKCPAFFLPRLSSGAGGPFVVPHTQHGSPRQRIPRHCSTSGSQHRHSGFFPSQGLHCFGGQLGLALGEVAFETCRLTDRITGWTWRWYPCGEVAGPITGYSDNLIVGDIGVRHTCTVDVRDKHDRKKVGSTPEAINYKYM